MGGHLRDAIVEIFCEPCTSGQLSKAGFILCPASELASRLQRVTILGRRNIMTGAMRKCKVGLFECDGNLPITGTFDSTFGVGVCNKKRYQL